MEAARAHAFAQDWVQAWNRHDVDAVLAHFADAVTFTSPVAARIVAGSDGVIPGKAALRGLVNEALRFDGELVVEDHGTCRSEGHGTYRSEGHGTYRSEGHGTYRSEGHGTYCSEAA